MKLLKYLTILVLILLGAYWGGWHYVMGKQIGELNDRYAGKKFLVKGRGGSEYYVTFTKAKSAGFPFKVGAEIIGWKEESRSAEISYPDSIYAGYDFFSQKIYIYYGGEINAAYKPVKNQFGARFEVDDYLVTIDLPLSKELIDTVKKLKDPFQLVNHMGKIRVSTDEVKIFDMQGGKKFYDKSFEEFELTFKPRKKYESLEDFMANIPVHYHIDYRLKTGEAKEPARRLPVSLFYGFMIFPNNFHGSMTADISTNARTFEEFGQDIDMKVVADFSSEYVNLKSYQLKYSAQRGHSTKESRKLGAFVIDSKVKLFVKSGAFDALFSQYRLIRRQLLKTSPGKILNGELEYIIKNKEAFRFKDLENSNYEFIVKADGAKKASAIQMNLENFSVVGDQSGVKFSHKSNIRTKKPKNWNARGVLLLHNYLSVVEFTSGYIYRFGNFRGLDDEARKIYVKVNKKFLKRISDYPESKSNDLSFEYEIDSKNLLNTKIGSIRFDQLGALYQAELFKELLAHVGSGGDVIGRMKKIIPDLDENSEILRKVIPGLKKLEDQGKLDKLVPKELKKVLPKEAGDIINKILPHKGKKKIDKDLWKNLLK